MCTQGNPIDCHDRVGLSTEYLLCHIGWLDDGKDLRATEVTAHYKDWIALVGMAAKAVDFFSAYYGDLRNYLWGLCIDHRFCRVIFPLFALEDVVEDIHYILNHKRQSYEIELPV